MLTGYLLGLSLPLCKVFYKKGEVLNEKNNVVCYCFSSVCYG